MEKIYVGHVSYQGLISTPYKKLLQTNNEKRNNSIKCQKLKYYLTNEDIKLINKHTNSFSTLLVSRKKIKILMSYYYTAIRTAKISKTDNTKSLQSDTVHTENHPGNFL